MLVNTFPIVCNKAILGLASEYDVILFLDLDRGRPLLLRISKFQI